MLVISMDANIPCTPPVLQKLMTRVAEHAAAAEDAHYLGRHAGMMALAMEQDRLAKTYLSTNMRAVVAASKVNAALGGRPLTQVSSAPAALEPPHPLAAAHQ
jgi:hypothetical protein